MRVPAAMSTSGTIAATNGTMTSRALRACTMSRSCAGKWSTWMTSPTFSPSRTTSSPTSWWSYHASGSDDSWSSWSTQRIALSEPLGGGRSSTPSKKATGWPLYPAELAHGEVLAVPRRGLGHLEGELAPGMNRRSGSSV